MNARKKILLFLFVLYSPLVFSQLDSLSILGDLSENLTQSDNQVENNLKQDTQGVVNKDSNSQSRDFIDTEYGFTGGQSFINPPENKALDQPLEYFGYDYFNDQPSDFVQYSNIPVTPDYLIGPSDSIKIIIYGNTSRKYELMVSREGEIFIPEIGPLYVAGITYQALKELIQETVSNQLIGSEASVTLGSLRSIDIFVLGAAKNPGMYTINAISTLTNAIFKSGGIDISGSLRNIKVKRNGNIIKNFDFYDLLLNGDTSNDIRLMSGDVVFIEPIGKTAGIKGEVNRPGIYELRENENISQLLQFAGRLKSKANRANVDIIRIDSSNNSFNLMTVDLSSEANKNLELNDGDVLFIHTVIDNLQNAVLVSGHAQQPGFYSWRQGMKIGDIIKSSNDLLEMTDINYALVKRKDPISQQYSFLQVDFEEIFSNLSSNKNITLLNRDEILLLPSLLSPELITTRMIQDQYLLDEENDMFVLEDEWTSLTYLRKSLMEDTLEIDKQNTIFSNKNGAMISSSGPTKPDLDIRRYYEYSIFDYCTIPDDMAIAIVEESGFRAKKSIPIEELEELKSPEDFLSLQQVLEQEKLKNAKKDDLADARAITNLCRNQLLDPMIDLIKRSNFGEKLSIVSVFGSVHFPRIYPYAENMTLSDAIKAAGGPKNTTYNAEVELSTLNNTGKRFSGSNNFYTMQKANKIKLSKMDTVNLKQVSSGTKTVKISGEVYFPGLYPIAENQTLSELITRAGGMTEYSSSDAAYFQREALKKAEKERLSSVQRELNRKILLSSQSAGLGQDSTGLAADAINQLNVLSENKDIEVLGRLVIDLEGIIDGRVDDIVLEDGDTITIPKRKQSISVIGEVFVSNSHLYDDRYGVTDYINLSGGATTFADESNIYLIKVDGSIISPSQLSSGFFRGRGSVLEPGDTIVVPLEIQPFSGVKATTEITQIIYQMALAAAAVNSF